jgi:hypothetical protein
MVDAKVRSEWGQTASIMALIANCNRDPKKRRAFEARDFMPAPLRPKRFGGLPWSAEDRKKMARRAGIKVPDNA